MTGGPPRIVRKSLNSCFNITGISTALPTVANLELVLRPIRLPRTGSSSSSLHPHLCPRLFENTRNPAMCFGIGLGLSLAKSKNRRISSIEAFVSPSALRPLTRIQYPLLTSPPIPSSFPHPFIYKRKLYSSHLD